MKNLLLTLSLTIPSLSFACVDLSGTYSMCKSHLGIYDYEKVTINQSNLQMSVMTTTSTESSSTDYILDGISRTSEYEIDGEKGELSTTANCDATQVKIDYVVDVSNIVIETANIVTKDSEGRLVITDYFDGDELNKTICEPLK